MDRGILSGGRAFSAFLFDMDGTLLSSVVAAERVWARWASGHGLDIDAFLPTIHGVRAIDTVRRWVPPGFDAEAEASKVTLAEIEDIDGIAQIAGAEAFLSSLPENRWGIVTSAPRALARRRLEAVGLPAPVVLITADDVTNGKPHPDCYRLAAQTLGFDASDCLVFEDAPAGINAGEQAGASVLVICATHMHPLETAHPGIDDYDGLRVSVDADGSMRLHISND
ncbi:MAG: HAD family hydrolase [Sphingobium phenoxybenzoativorans]